MCQRFFRNRAASSWFEVSRDRQDVSRGKPNGDGDEMEKFAAFIKGIHNEDEAYFRKDTKVMIQAGDDKLESVAWLNRTGWAVHLSGLDRTAMREMMGPIQDDEVVLQRMREIFNRVMDSAYVTTTGCTPGSAELFEVERNEAQGNMPSKPFTGRMEPDAWARYKAWWITLLTIWYRVEQRDEDDRPPYRMTIQQRELWTKFVTAVELVATGADTVGRYTDERVDASCLNMVIAFLDHQIKSGRHDENIVISALAVMGLKEDGGWMMPLEYTPIYSAVVKVSRMMVLHQSIKERDKEIAQLEQVMDRQAAEEKAPGLFRIVRRKVRRFMTRISSSDEAEPTPMWWIMDTRTYGIKVRFTTPGGETVDWRGDQIIHGRVRLGMGQLSDMVHNMTDAARHTLAALTMVDEASVAEALPRIPWSRIEDRHGETAVGHSFLHDPGNAWWLEAGNDWVVKQIAASDTRRTAWIVESLDERHPYRGKAIRDYDRIVDQFREQMLVLMHMTGGQPARSPEVLGLRMWNTMNGGVRNIFIHNGMVCFVTMYHKGFRQTNSAKVIHRYVPREVGALLIWYMWLALPFWQNVQRRVKGKTRRSAFLWADEVVSEGGPMKVRVKEQKDGDDGVHHSSGQGGRQRSERGSRQGSEPGSRQGSVSGSDFSEQEIEGTEGGGERAGG